MPRNKKDPIREAVVNYLGGFCVECGATEGLAIHHIIPICLGGINSLGNMEVLCKSCHYKLHRTASWLISGRRRYKGDECKICGFPRSSRTKSALCDKCERKRSAERYNKLKLKK